MPSARHERVTSCRERPDCTPSIQAVRQTERVTRSRHYRLTALAVATLLVHVGVSACGSEREAHVQRECKSFDRAADETEHRRLEVAPNVATPGESIKVNPASKRRMDFSALIIYGDSRAGCRTFGLVLGSDDNSWIELTGKNQIALASSARTGVTSATYSLPDIAAPGNYIACAPHGLQLICGKFTIEKTK